MVEMMVVVGVIVILTGILIGSLPGIQSRINRGKVEAFLAELESGLSKYQIDYGTYPINEPGGDRDKSGVEGAAVLYKHLSGDRNLNGQADRVEEGAEADERIREEIYVSKLDYFSNRESKEPRSMVLGGEYMVIDSYSNPIRYLCQPPNLPKGKDRETRNPTYDLWSITDAKPGDSEDEAKYITNWSGL